MINKVATTIYVL